MISSAGQQLFRDLCDVEGQIVLTTHMNPDGDALGSEIGLARFLATRGRRVRLVNPDPTPELLRFLVSDEHPVETYDPASHDDLLLECERVVLVDNSAPDRLGRLEPLMARVAGHTLCIDHHPARDTPWAEIILDESACATAIMIHELVRGAGWTPDLPAATALYVGLATDTGFFRFNSTDADAYQAAADLVRQGVEPFRIYRAIYERNSEAYTRLLGHALVGLTVERGQLAYVAITRQTLVDLQAEDVDSSEITTALLAMDGITVALLFRELDGGRVKVSLRSKGVLDVHKLAAEFGGGGHRNASGIVMDGTLDQAVQVITERTTALLAD